MGAMIAIRRPFGSMGCRSLRLPERYEAVKRDKEPDVLRPYIRRRNHRHRSGFSSTVKLSCIPLICRCFGTRHPWGVNVQPAICETFVVISLDALHANDRARIARWMIGSDRLFVLEISPPFRTRRDLRGSFGACVQFSVFEYVCHQIFLFFSFECFCPLRFTLKYIK